MGRRTLKEIERNAVVAVLVLVGVHLRLGLDVEEGAVTEASQRMILTPQTFIREPIDSSRRLPFEAIAFTPSSTSHTPSPMPPHPLSQSHPSQISHTVPLPNTSDETLTHPLGKLVSKSLCGPSTKLARLNQLTFLFPFSSLVPLLTPSEYLITSRPVEVGLIEGVSARRPISCIFARERGVLVLKARAAARGQAEERSANIAAVVCGEVVEMVDGCGS